MNVGGSAPGNPPGHPAQTGNIDQKHYLAIFIPAIFLLQVILYSSIKKITCLAKVIPVEERRDC